MDFKSFFYQSVSKLSPVEVSLSSRFKEPFLVQPLTEMDHIRAKNNARKNAKGEIDINDYFVSLCCESVIVPDLKNLELQDSYHVMGAKNLLKTMLTAGEFSTLLHQIEKISLFEQNMEHTLSQVKKP